MKLHKTIPKESIGIRLDTFIATIHPPCSRAQAAVLAARGEFFVNNISKKASYRLKAGDIISGTIPDQPDKVEILPEKTNLDILYEDDHIVVINKPPGMVVHPAPGNLSGTLVNGLLYHEPEIKQTCEDSLRPGIVHRLDKDTSGVMVVAKNQASLIFLQKEFKYRRVEKQYLALVHEQISKDKGEIDLPIGRHSVKRKVMAVQPDSGKKALTLWQVQKRFATATLVKVILKTGRTHQIRVHFYALGHPLVGDQVYQHRRFRKKGSPLIAPRQMLHSCFLGFRHPFSGIRMEFEAPLPKDFLASQDVL